VGRRLVGDEVEPFARSRPSRLDLRRVADQRDADGVAVRGRFARPGKGFGGSVGEALDIADVEPATRSCLVDLDGQADALVHRDRERLCAAHPAQTRGQGHGPAQAPTEMAPGGLGERLVRPLQDALGADVDPRARGHLAVHRQALALELAEDLPRRPLPDEVRVGDQDPGRPGMRPDDPDRLAGLDEQGLVVGQGPELADDRIEGVPRARRTTRSAVDDQAIGILGDLRVEVVHEHAQRGFLGPAATAQLRTARGANGSGAGERFARAHGFT
jgi:hypothetical protein